jgi:hypothetical protein
MLKSLLGNVVELARTNYLTETNKKHYSRSNARSDHGVLELSEAILLRPTKSIIHDITVLLLFLSREKS